MSKRRGDFRKRFCGLQKESLGEYGSGWEWENTSILAFDQESIIIDTEDSRIAHTSPVRYIDEGTKQSTCLEDITQTNGELLTSGSNMMNQTSCKADTGNAGNWYSWSASTAGGQSSSKEPNSICPKGWQLTTNTATDSKSYYYLIRTTYNIQETDSDSRVRPLPMSFIRSGNYTLGSLNLRGSYGRYWSAVGGSSTGAYYLDFRSGYLNPQNASNKSYGFAVRCVSR